MRRARSRALLRRAVKRIPGGVNSPVRAYHAVGGTPPFIASGRGATLTDEDGNRYVDYVGSWGALILGHAHPAVLRAVRDAAAKGTSFGAPTRLEVELAERVCEALPAVERVRFVSSGTEATMSALRLARAATGRKRVLKFEGCYHGHAEAGHHLVEDQQRGVAVAELAQPLEEAGQRRHAAHVPRHGLDDDAGELGAEARKGGARGALVVEGHRHREGDELRGHPRRARR